MVANLVVHPVVGQGERRGRLLAGAVEVEVVVCHMAVPPVHLLVQVDVDVDAAGVVVGLQVEGLGHRLRRGGEGELARVAIATHHVLADVVVQLNGVVGPTSRSSMVSSIVWLPASMNGLVHHVWHSQPPSESSSQTS